MKHPLRAIDYSNGYIDNFSDLAIDVDGDGWVDVVQCSYFAHNIVWLKNPGRSGGAWKVTEIDNSGPTEFAFLVDLNNDGKALELLTEFDRPNVPAAWFELIAGKWIKHVVAQRSYGHGIGVGDMNGDGHNDIVIDGDSQALSAYNAVTGATAPGFPKWTGGFGLWTPAVGDFAGTGRTVVLAQTREGYLHAWRTPGRLGGENAWHWHQDDRNTGHLGTDTRPPAAVRGLTVTRLGAIDTLAWRPTGDDWTIGVPANYQVLWSPHPITQFSSREARVLRTVPGTVRSISVAHSAGRHYVVRAIDDAGNIGPLPVRAEPAPR